MAGRLFADGGYELGKRPRLMGDQGGMFFEGGGGMGGLGPLGFGGSPHHLAAMAAMAPNLSMLSGHHGPRLFPVVKLRGLPFNCTDSDVIDFFLGLDVVDVLMLRKGSRFCGEAFVVFGAPVQVDYALQKNRQNMGRRYIEVFRAKKADYYTAIAHEVALGPPEEAADAPERPDRRRLNSMAIVPSGSRVNQEKAPTEPTSVLKMRGLPFSVAKQDIIEFFEGFSLADDSIHIVVSAEGRPKGEAFVEFSSPADAQAAMDKDKMLLGKRYVELFYSSREEATKAARPL